MTEFVVDLSAWRIRNFNSFLAAVGTNDFTALAAEVGLVIKQWPFEGSPSDPEAFMNLALGDLPKIIGAINEEMKALFSKGN